MEVEYGPRYHKDGEMNISEHIRNNFLFKRISFASPSSEVKVHYSEVNHLINTFILL